MTLSAPERRLFTECDPLGFILFSRNVESKAQVQALVEELRVCVGRADAPVLIDQEGGRIMRLRPPIWRAAPAARRIADLAAIDPAAGERAAWLNARLLAHELDELGIDVDCAPVLDIPQADADSVISDRAVGHDVASTIRLGRAWCDGLLAGGVAPVIKHLPGHGRATVDSHKGLPIVDTDREVLEATDLAPFQALAAASPWAMTAHVVYTALDRERPATLSPVVVNQVIRSWIGFDGVLVTDDLNMGALSGPIERRVVDSLNAGCDVALHCSRSYEEKVAIAGDCPPLSDAGAARLARAAISRRSAEECDAAAIAAELDRLFGLAARVA